MVVWEVKKGHFGGEAHIAWVPTRTGTARVVVHVDSETVAMISLGAYHCGVKITAPNVNAARKAAVIVARGHEVQSRKDMWPWDSGD